MKLDVATTLPMDGYNGALVGRIWRPDVGGPSVVAIRPDGVHDISLAFPTVRDLCEQPDPAMALRLADGFRVAPLDMLLRNTPPDPRNKTLPWLLAPVDLQAVKAAGVTFAVSLLERVIEEQARGVPGRAAEIRAEILATIGSELPHLRPGSAEAAALKALLIERGLWSQYLEVGIGPDAEIFTKALPLSSVGHGAEIGIHPVSQWNNPEPEVVLIVASSGRIVGASLGNDVNLRDIEGRSALLLPKAKDNNASCAIGPFIRFFDKTFTLDTIRGLDVSVSVMGDDGFVLEGRSSHNQISRDPAALVEQMIGVHHHYPDGAALFLGTMFAPVDDRDSPGQGFTHKIGDIVSISTSSLGMLVNRVAYTHEAEPWTFGVSDLMRNLAQRALI